MRIHELKLDREFFDVVLSGEKPFEVRRNDRGYQKGDNVIFKESRDGVHYTHYRAATAEITYVLNGWGVCEGFVAFGITNVTEVKE